MAAAPKENWGNSKQTCIYPALKTMAGRVLRAAIAVLGCFAPSPQANLRIPIAIWNKSY
jgi:hypothetical protein